MRTEIQAKSLPARNWLMPATAAVIVALGLMLSGCNTTQGVGEDVSATGHAVTRGATAVKNGL